MLYFDYQASTPLDPRVLEGMLPYMSGVFANPHARHVAGREAFMVVSQARENVAKMVGASSSSIIFTSGATEANNLAILGAARYRRRQEGRDHIITTSIEHPSVLRAVEHLKEEGFCVDFLPVDGEGRISLDDVYACLSERTSIISVMAVNHEIGVINPLKQVGDAARGVGAWFHCDGVQGASLLNLDANALGIDMMSLSSHKIYGPKGIGALYIRHQRPRVQLDQLFYGGGQEIGYRSGTIATPLCVGFGLAASLVTAERDHDASHLQNLRHFFMDEMRQKNFVVGWNGPAGDSDHIPSNISMTVGGITSVRDVLDALDEAGVMLSLGSACSAQDAHLSHVLRAVGKKETPHEVTFRISLGRMTTYDHIVQLVQQLEKIFNQ